MTSWILGLILRSFNFKGSNIRSSNLISPFLSNPLSISQIYPLSVGDDSSIIPPFVTLYYRDDVRKCFRQNDHRLTLVWDRITEIATENGFKEAKKGTNIEMHNYVNWQLCNSIEHTQYQNTVSVLFFFLFHFHFHFKIHFISFHFILFLSDSFLRCQSGPH